MITWHFINSVAGWALKPLLPHKFRQGSVKTFNQRLSGIVVA